MKTIPSSRREQTGGDQCIVFPYASGMSTRRDMAAAITSPAGLGVEIGNVSDAGIQSIVEAVCEQSKPVFVDSGAFNAFRKAIRCNDMSMARVDFDRVFEKYEALSAGIVTRATQQALETDHWHLTQTIPKLLTLVAPDVVGDQTETLALIEQHAETIATWIERGHEVIIPFQKGPLLQSEMFNRVIDILGFGCANFVVGIPSAAEALSNEDLQELLSHPYKPDRIHILGAVSSQRFRDRMDVIRAAYEDDVPGITADACVMRSKIGELAGLYGQRKFDQIVDICSRVVPALYGGQLSDFRPYNQDDEDLIFFGAGSFDLPVEAADSVEEDLSDILAHQTAPSKPRRARRVREFPELV